MRRSAGIEKILAAAMADSLQQISESIASGSLPRRHLLRAKTIPMSEARAAMHRGVLYDPYAAPILFSCRRPRDFRIHYDVQQALPQRRQHWGLQHLQRSHAQAAERCKKISAVDRRSNVGADWFKRRRGVPVQQMSFPFRYAHRGSASLSASASHIPGTSSIQG